MPVARKPAGGGKIDPAPEGTFVARCYRVLDLGTQDKKWEGHITQQYQTIIMWELPTELMPPREESPEEERPYSISQVYNLSLHEKANLRKHLETWRGKKFTKEEEDGFEVGNVLGHPCMISVVHNVTPDKTYANVGAIMALPTGMDMPPPFNEPMQLDLQAGKYQPQVYEALSDGMKEWIAKSPEWKALQSSGTAPPVVEKPPLPDPPAGDDFDDSVPF